MIIAAYKYVCNKKNLECFQSILYVKEKLQIQYVHKYFI